MRFTCDAASDTGHRREGNVREWRKDATHEKEDYERFETARSERVNVRVDELDGVDEVAIVQKQEALA